MFSPSQGSSSPNNSIPESWACLESRACQESRPPESRPGARLPSPRAPPRSLAPLASPGGPGHAPSGPFVRSSRGRPRTPLRCAGPSTLRRCCRAWNQDVAPGRRSHVGLRDLRRYLLAGVGGSRALPLSGNRRLGLGLPRIHVALPAAGRRGRARRGCGESSCCGSGSVQLRGM